jgi:hypothetical protein
MESRLDGSHLNWFLAGQAEPINFQMVGDAVSMEEVGAGQVGAHRTRGQFSKAGGTATDNTCIYISWSP